MGVMDALAKRCGANPVDKPEPPTCPTCPYRMPLTTGGECHHDTPSRRSLEDSSGTWPFILDTDWCGHHPSRNIVFSAELKTSGPAA